MAAASIPRAGTKCAILSCAPVAHPPRTRLASLLLGPQIDPSGAAHETRDLTEKILDIKREKAMELETHLRRDRRLSPTLIVGALLGQKKLVKPLARSAAVLFDLPRRGSDAQRGSPSGAPMPPTDPLIYRFFELVMVNSPAWKALIEEEFGDGIMSAIDFDFGFEREPNPKGDRVKVTMSGKFLPYKYYGAGQGMPEYGFKETN